jgi:hypothetical protein
LQSVFEIQQLDGANRLCNYGLTCREDQHHPQKAEA